MNKQGRDGIGWCDYTWNPITGCLHGCEYCYARKIAERFGGYSKRSAIEYGNTYTAYSSNAIICKLDVPLLKDTPRGEQIAPFPFGFDPTFYKYRLGEPAKVKIPSKIFVCSMADLFGEWIPDEWIKEVFEACEAAPQHSYIFLTKNPERYGKLNGKNHRYDWSFVKENWWFGMTITGNGDIDKLRHLPYGHTNTFISIEPLQGNIDLNFYLPKESTKYKCSYCGHLANYYSSHCQHCNKEDGYSGSFRKHPINWVIIGQETGNKAKPTKPEWVQSIIDQSRVAGVPVFVKSPLFRQFPIQEWPEGLRKEIRI